MMPCRPALPLPGRQTLGFRQSPGRESITVGFKSPRISIPVQTINVGTTTRGEFKGSIQTLQEEETRTFYDLPARYR